MEKPSLFARLSAYLKGGELKDVTRFETRLFDRIERDIKEREVKISDLKEHIADAQVELNDAVFDIDTNQIKSIDAAKAYTSPYLAKLQSIMIRKEGYEEQIDTLKAEIKRFKDISSVIQNATAPEVKEK